ncbi:MAG: cbb3-type cytochrome c oxidase subunit I [Candidatus Sumerlaeota bacterium]|nr:cbb3-type cytochrome c oxidase subunit I [Candidatus Sumerlaeota bacterium]
MAHPSDNYLTHTRGIKSWLLTLDHKRIGIMYLVTILGAFLLAGIFALLIRTELLTPGQTIVTADTYNRLFTLHGAIMIFLFVIPGIPSALGNFVLPLQLGAKDVAFPRLNLFSYYLFVFGAALMVLSIIVGGVDTGWTFYTPYSTDKARAGVIPVLTGVFLLGFSSIFTGLNFIVSIHKLRAPGMGWFRMPLFLWGLYATAIMQILATPVLGITLLLLIVERVLGVGIFDPGLGGDPVLFQHFFWFYSHPAVYIMVLPAMGVISELVSVHSHKHIFSYKMIAWSSVAIAVFSFFVWGHHMFVSGQSAMANMIFSALTFSVAIPTAVKVFNWLATMFRGAITLTTPMCYAVAFLSLFAIGGLTGMFLGSLATNVHVTDTYFVVAHFHFTMVPVGVAFIGGLYHWWPKITGRMYSEKWGRIGCAVFVAGFYVTFVTQFIMGTHGMPRRSYHYLPEFTALHQMSSAGALAMATGLFIAAGTFIHSLVKGLPAAANPWGGASFEWQCPSPPPHDNFTETPPAGDPYDMSDWEYHPEIRGYVRKT